MKKAFLAGFDKAAEIYLDLCAVYAVPLAIIAVIANIFKKEEIIKYTTKVSGLAAGVSAIMACEAVVGRHCLKRAEEAPDKEATYDRTVCKTDIHQWMEDDITEPTTSNEE